MIGTIFYIIFALLFLAGIVLLQIFLSERESRWPGLILPILAFLFGLLYPLNMAVPDGGVTVGFIFRMLLVWLLGNIPTIVLMGIYLGCREKHRRRKALDKMNIQDLG